MKILDRAKLFVADAPMKKNPKQKHFSPCDLTQFEPVTHFLLQEVPHYFAIIAPYHWIVWVAILGTFILAIPPAIYLFQ